MIGGCRRGLGPLLASLSLAVVLTCALIAASSGPVAAQSLNLDLGEGGGSSTSRLVQLIGLVTVLSLAPSILVMVTSFTRIIVVLSFLRSAMGIQQTPPNSVLISLALFLTAFIMMPTMQVIYDDALIPLVDDRIDEIEAVERAAAPVRSFMLDHVRDQDLRLFMDMAQVEPVQSVEETPMRALIPAFMISELRRAFEIGFLLFLPFLVIDMVVASVLISMGMLMLPPVIISLPFKVLLFVLVDGWHMIVGSLVQSFH